MKRFSLFILVFALLSLSTMAQDDTVTLTLVNELDQSICGVFIKPPEDELWGQNEIGRFQVFPSGRSMDYEIESGMYDLGIVGCESDVFATVRDIEMESSMTYTVDDEFITENESDIQITRTYGARNIFTEPDIDSEIIIRTAPAEIAIVIEEITAQPISMLGLISDRWYQVELNGAIGYLWWGHTEMDTIELLAGIQNEAGIFIDNTTDATICDLYVKPSSEEWAESHNRLNGSVYPLKFIPEQSGIWLDLEPDIYDIWMVTCPDPIVITEENIEIETPSIYTLDEEKLEEAQATTDTSHLIRGTLRLVNESESIICYIYALPEGSDEWLRAEFTLASGQETKFSMFPGTYAVIIEDCDNNVLMQWDDVEIDDSVTLTYTGEE